MNELYYYIDGVACLARATIEPHNQCIRIKLNGANELLRCTNADAASTLATILNNAKARLPGADAATRHQIDYTLRWIDSVSCRGRWHKGASPSVAELEQIILAEYRRANADAQ